MSLRPPLSNAEEEPYFLAADAGQKIAGAQVGEGLPGEYVTGWELAIATRKRERFLRR